MIKCEEPDCSNILPEGTKNRFCSKSCRSRYAAKSSLEKRKQTCLEKYGVPNPAKSLQVKEKTKQTNVAKYGVEHISQVEEFKQTGDKNCMHRKDVKEKISNTVRAKYGVEWYSKSPEYRQKYVRTMLSRYGVDNPLKSPQILEEIRANNLKKYNRSSHRQAHINDNSQNIVNDINLLIELNSKYNLTEIANALGVSKSFIAKKFSSCGVIPKRHGNRSAFQNEVYEFIKTHLPDDDILCNHNGIISKELDIYIPKYRLAIECNGTFFHCERFGKKDKTYHISKTKACEAKGIKLIHIFSHVWEDKKDIVKSIILNSINLSNRRVYARQCKIAYIDSDTSRKFLEENHIQGYVSAEHSIGLFYKDELVSVATFGRSRFNRKYDYELLRMCNKLNCTVVGGASRMVKHFINTRNPKNIISYSHKHLFDGKVYKLIGFNKISESAPSYFYTKNYKVVFNRIKFQKHKLSSMLDAFDDSLSEWENMKLNSWDRFWDCGNDVWLLKIRD